MAGEHAGASLVEMLWEQLDAQYAKLCRLHEETGGVTADDLYGWITSPQDLDADSAIVDDAMDYLQTQGKVQGLCVAVGTITDPYLPIKERIDKIRGEVRERWEAENDADDEE